MNAMTAVSASPAPAIPFWPRLLSADFAAAYMGIGETFFLDCVSKHTLPAPVRLGRRKLWDRHMLDQCVDAMIGLDEPAAKGNDNFFGD
jgi:predicted DNA-binding transcriptional regulator AlpA